MTDKTFCKLLEEAIKHAPDSAVADALRKVHDKACGGGQVRPLDGGSGQPNPPKPPQPPRTGGG